MVLGELTFKVEKRIVQGVTISLSTMDSYLRALSLRMKISLWGSYHQSEFQGLLLWYIHILFHIILMLHKYHSIKLMQILTFLDNLASSASSEEGMISYEPL